MSLRAVDADDYELFWELMGAFALGSVLRGAQHDFPETKMEDN